MSPPPRLPRKPEARTEKVEDLVERVLRGVVRVPAFQRRLKWNADAIRDLFDSIYRGYPIGSLLFYKRPAAAKRLEIGPLGIDAPEISEAWWVVDGQQRLTALAGCLARSVPIPTEPSRDDPHVLYFDSVRQSFEPPPRGGVIPASWVPLPYLLDASRLTEWVFGWDPGQDEATRRIVFEAGTRLREYPLPLYLIEAVESAVAQTIYYRVNKAGITLGWTDVHRALFGGADAFPATLDDLSDELAQVGMGRLGQDRLLTCLFALRGLDPTRTLAEHLRKSPDELRDAVRDALPVVRRVLSFLRQDAGIPHTRLLPKSILLDVLVRFFAQHSDPRPRSRALLVRWYWRTVLGAGRYDDRTLRRRGIDSVVPDEEASVQKLLGLVRKERPRPFELPQAFDPRADASRIALLAMAHAGPRHLATGAPLDLAGLLEAQDDDAFARIVRQRGLVSSRSPANRLLHPRGQIQKLIEQHVHVERLNQLFIDGGGGRHGPVDLLLESHAIDGRCAELLAAGQLEDFLSRRAEILTGEANRFCERMASWDHNDRPSLDYLLAEVSAAP